MRRYEELRRGVMSGSGRQATGEGLALVLHRGVAAWLEAWSKCLDKPSVEPVGLGKPAATVSAELYPELSLLLAGMVLAAVGVEVAA